MSVQEQITRISGAKTSIAEAIAAKGVSVPSGTKIDGMAPLIGNIDVGEKLDAELAEQDNLIAQIQTALEGKAAGSGGGASVETCTVTVDAFSLTISSYTSYLDEEFQVNYYFNAEHPSVQLVLTDVVCGSAIHLNNNYGLNGATLSGGVEKIYIGTFGMIFKAPTTAGANATITIYDND